MVRIRKRGKMKLVAFTDNDTEKEVLVNCDNIAFVLPSLFTTAIYLTTYHLLTVIEDYEEVKRRIQE